MVPTEPARQTEAHLLGIQEELSRREPIFHRPEFGTSREALLSMTADEFWEVGASGRRYSRDHVIEILLERYARGENGEYRAEDFHCQQLAPATYLLTYTLHEASRITRRCTLWRRVEAGWKIVYHQGTIVE